MKKLLFFLTLVFVVMGIIVLSVLLEKDKQETPPSLQQPSASSLQN